MGSVSMGMASRKVLVVDDERTVKRLLEFGFTRAGYEIVTAADSAEGLELARTACPDYIMLNLATPRTAGCEMLHAVKADPATAGIPVVLVTDFGRDYDIFQGWLAGVSAYITNPVNVEDLSTLLQRIESYRNAA